MRSGFSFSLPPRSTTFLSENLLHPQYDLVSLGPIPNAKLVIAIRIEEPLTRVPDHARTDRSYLLRRVLKRDAIEAAICDLPEIVGVWADPKVFANVVRSGGVEVDRRSCLCRLSACCEW